MKHFFPFIQGWSMQITDLKEVFHTPGKWNKWIVRRRDSSESLARGSFDAHSQRHKHTCVAGMNIAVYSLNVIQHTQALTVSPRREVRPCWGDQTGSMFFDGHLCCTHKLTKISHCLIPKSFFFKCTIQWVKYGEMKRWYLVFHNISALHGAE